MSVINKMLKDLEQRQDTENPSLDGAPNATFQPQDNKQNKVLIISLSLVILVLASVVAWMMFDNSSVTPTQLVTDVKQPAIETTVAKQTPVIENTEINNDFASASETRKANNDTPVASVKKAQTQSIPINVNRNKENKKAEQNEVADVQNNDIVAVASASPNIQNQPESQLSDNEAEQTAAKGQEAASVTKMSESTQQPAQTESQITNAQPTEDTNGQTATPEQTESEISPSTPRLSIEKTSKVLTKQQRVDNLMEKAKKSLNSGYITEAIEQFKEVLLADDAHVEARNLLAVAWYGRGENQMAVTILNDGLGRYPQVEEWRLTAAKMFFKENNPSGAFSYLEADLLSASTEYYRMKGSLARQLQRFDKAESAYSMLTQLQPDVGNWWLGYAISLDSQSKSQLALASYKMVVEKGGVSKPSLDFVLQRIEQLQG